MINIINNYLIKKILELIKKNDLSWSLILDLALDGKIGVFKETEIIKLIISVGHFLDPFTSKKTAHQKPVSHNIIKKVKLEKVLSWVAENQDLGDEDLVNTLIWNKNTTSSALKTIMDKVEENKKLQLWQKERIFKELMLNEKLQDELLMHLSERIAFVVDEYLYNSTDERLRQRVLRVSRKRWVPIFGGPSNKYIIGGKIIDID